MNYEFHVGDYVETYSGAVGYIISIEDDAFTWVNHTPIRDGDDVYFNVEQRNFYSSVKDVFARIGAYDFTKKEKKEIGELEDIENIDVKDWLPVFVVYCIRDCIDRMATGKSRWFTAYSSDYTTHTFDEYEAAMYLQDLIDEKFGNRRHHR